MCLHGLPEFQTPAHPVHRPFSMKDPDDLTDEAETFVFISSDAVGINIDCHGGFCYHIIFPQILTDEYLCLKIH